MIRIATIEDEKIIQEEICRVITSVTNHKEEIKVDSYFSAEDYFLAAKAYELVITDIELPGISGLELGRKVRQMNPEVYLVFLTSYSEFASESYIIEAYQYILKKDMQERLPALVDKVVARIKKENSEFFWIGNSRDIKKIYYKEIIYIKKIKGSKYAEYVTADGMYTARLSLNQVFEKIKNNGFILADRAHVVNVNHVKRLRGNTIYMDNGEEIEVSRVQSLQVKEKIAEYWRLLK